MLQGLSFETLSTLSAWAKAAVIVCTVMIGVLQIGATDRDYQPMHQDDEGPYPVTKGDGGYSLAAEDMAKCAWGEARGESKTRQAAVMWCILNRVEAEHKDIWDGPVTPGSINEVIKAPGQFFGYHPYNPVEPELYDLALDVLSRWQAEVQGYVKQSGRVLPKEYLFFTSRGGVNCYGTEYDTLRGVSGMIWDWSLESPYE